MKDAQASKSTKSALPALKALWCEVMMAEVKATLTPSRKARGAVYIDRNRCKGCGFCIEFCPPKVLAFAESYNEHGYHPPQLIRTDGCTGCDLCGLYCPDFAIFGIRQAPAPQAGEGGAGEG
jgi:2-oxoglutarate ferredoxin oxidoreductase subunit delta